MVKYSYNAYGMKGSITGPMATTIGNLNPFRYKWYYYDVETNFYYCKSRYYSPEIYRWLSRDDVEHLDTSNPIGCNLYLFKY